MKTKTGIIILAAGSSSRLGSPKQLLEFKGSSLLKRISMAALDVPDAAVCIVVGAFHDLVRTAVAHLPVSISINPQWQSGLSSSIRTGLQKLLTIHPGIEQCIISLCDQPFVDQHVFLALDNLADQSGKGIVVTGFDGTWGPPTLFGKKYFRQLIALEGHEGAKKIASQYPEDRIVFDFDAAKFDIDTAQDYFDLPHQLISVEQATAIINHFLPTARQQHVSIQQALGYTLAQSVAATQQIPGFPQSSMDGYAIRYADRFKTLRVTDKIPAGSRTMKTLLPEQAMRIYTGAPVPDGADTVVMQEKVERLQDNHIVIKDDSLRFADHVRPQGSEVEAGTTAMLPGTFLSPAAIGYLAGIGCAEVDIFAAPKVHILLTGDELKPLGSPLNYGEVYESNSFQLDAALKQLGIQQVHMQHVKDDREALETTLNNALTHADIVLLVGGVSVGDYDYVVDTAKTCGVRQRFHRIRQKPGKPLFFGTKDTKLVFGLPGNPSSALTCFYLYVAPALEQIMQLPHRNRIIKTYAAQAYAKKPGLTHFLKATYDGQLVTPLHAQESYRLQSYAQANCLLILDESSTGCQTGDEVLIYLLT